jgi:thymidylate synthase (FAD)
MPRKETSTDMGYLANIIKQGHFSVLEHGSATFYIEGVSRNLTQELIRHRHLSYSELSQRYVDMSNANFVVPLALRDNDVVAANGLCPLSEYGEGEDDDYTRYERHPQTLYEKIVADLVKSGRTRKQAREAARFYLPSGMETKIVVTGNHRAWRDMLQKRYSVHADAEIRELATELLKVLRSIAPATYQDFPEEPFA